MQHVEVGSEVIAYRQAGRGPALVLLHGVPADSRVWRIAIEDLSDDFTVIAWDAPGCGQSSDPPETWRMPQYADCLDGFLEALGHERAHVLGHSWGSSLALELADRHPTRLETILLVGGYAGWAGSLPPEEVAARLQFAHDVASRLPGGFDPRSMKGLFSDAMPADLADELITIMSESRSVGVRVTAHALAEADQRAMLGDISVPVLLLYGEHDERSPVSAGRALEAAIPTSTLVVMPGLGHVCSLESPERFAQEVRRFLKTTGT